MSLFFTSGFQSIGDYSFSLSPSNEYSGLISYRMDCFDLLAVQGTLKSLLQHHSSKASILQHSAFFIVQFSHPSRLLENCSFGQMDLFFFTKVMSLFFNMLSRLVIAFLPRIRRLLISLLQSPSPEILEFKKETLSMFPLFPYLFSMK